MSDADDADVTGRFSQVEQDRGLSPGMRALGEKWRVGNRCSEKS
jgi:hypothetical protein